MRPGPPLAVGFDDPEWTDAGSDGTLDSDADGAADVALVGRVDIPKPDGTMRRARFAAIRVGEARCPGPPTACGFDDPDWADSDSDGSAESVLEAFGDMVPGGRVDIPNPDGSVRALKVQPGAVHPADDGLDWYQLLMWRRAETLLGVKCGTVVSTPATTSVPPAVDLAVRTHDGMFIQSDTFLGPVPGFIFTSRASGTGYQPELDLG